MRSEARIRDFYRDEASQQEQGSPSFIQRILDDFLCTLHLAPTDKVLDLGSGIGNNLPVLRRHFAEIVAVDISESALKRSVHVHQHDQTLFVRDDISHLSFRSQSFDVVVCTETLEHVPDLTAAISEMGRVLKSHGHCIITVPNYLNFAGVYKCFRDTLSGRNDWNPWNAHHGGFERPMTPGLLDSTLRDDFRISETRGADYALAWLFFTPIRRFTGVKRFGRMSFLQRFGMHYCVLAEKK